MVCTDDRHVSNVRRKQNFVDRGLELDLSSEEFGDFGASAVAAMCQLYVGWNNASAGQLPAQADQDSREKLDLVAVHVTAYADIAIGNVIVFSANALQSYALIGYRGVADKALDGISQNLRGCGDIDRKSTRLNSSH